eukprot:TRINITY_DN1368_c0_g1_i18.p1 TRINITY_DN1368_c0_g1~~TRINITY_DN1368_c0_g1_i18.p1  ORF type:complete len:248 (+),score=21.86 TRINITY_DN1368_c0_g1_i18:464-1207(+)
MLLLLVLFVSLMIQTHFKPFKMKYLNTAEVLSITVSLTTIYSGIFYVTKIPEEDKFVFFLVIVAANTTFLFVIIFLMLGGRIKCIRRRLFVEDKEVMSPMDPKLLEAKSSQILPLKTSPHDLDSSHVQLVNDDPNKSLSADHPPKSVFQRKSTDIVNPPQLKKVGTVDSDSNADVIPVGEIDQPPIPQKDLAEGLLEEEINLDDFGPKKQLTGACSSSSPSKLLPKCATQWSETSWKTSQSKVTLKR